MDYPSPYDEREYNTPPPQVDAKNEKSSTGGDTIDVEPQSEPEDDEYSLADLINSPSTRTYLPTSETYSNTSMMSPLTSYTAPRQPKPQFYKTSGYFVLPITTVYVESKVTGD